MPRSLGVIPARYASTRFPGKAVAPLGDKTMIEVVWRRVAAARRLSRVIVAVDDDRIARALAGSGAEVMTTSAHHESGTDRVAEVVGRVDADFDVVVNVQADEPLVTPSCLDRLVAAFDASPRPAMATLSEPIEDADALFDPNVVKVVVDRAGDALYFSRSPVPYHRGSAAVLRADFRDGLGRRQGGLAGYRRHQGIYAWTRDTLLALSGLPVSALERDEGLEQLRALEAGFRIRVLESDFRSTAVDTPQDLERVAARFTEAT